MSERDIERESKNGGERQRGERSRLPLNRESDSGLNPRTWDHDMS